MSRMVVTLAMGAALLAGCGGDDKPADTAGGTAAPSGTQTARAASPAEDRRIARSSVLRLTDFPSGWQAKDDDDPASESPCDAIEEAKRAATSRQSSPTFEGEGESQVEDAVYVFADEAAAEEAFAGVSGPETRACFRDFAVDAIKEEAKGEDLTIGEIESGELRVDPVADDTAASRFTIPISSQGFDVDASLDLVVVRAERAVSFLVFTSVLTQFDEDLRGELTRAAGRRMEDALATT